METFSIKSNNKITINIKQGFYVAQAMVSIKAVGITQNQHTLPLSFLVKYSNANGYNVEFPLTLYSPFYFDAGNYNAENIINPALHGPYYFVEIHSSANNPDLIIQVGFTNTLA